MPQSYKIHGTDEVMAELIPGKFYRGKWQNIRVTGVSDDKDVPLGVRTSLVGLIVPTVFTKESIEQQANVDFQIPAGSRLTYSNVVIDALESKGRLEEARALRNVAPDSFDMYVFEKEIYEEV